MYLYNVNVETSTINSKIKKPDQQLGIRIFAIKC